MLKCQATKFNFGIPGESQCFECQQQFDEITDRFIHEFHYHSKVCERMSYEESKKMIKFANFPHRSLWFVGILPKFETFDFAHNGKESYLRNKISGPNSKCSTHWFPLGGFNDLENDCNLEKMWWKYFSENEILVSSNLQLPNQILDRFLPYGVEYVIMFLTFFKFVDFL